MRKKLKHMFSFLIQGVIGAVALFPILLLFTGSLLTREDLSYVNVGRLFILPPSITLAQYHEILIEKIQYVRSFQYSLLLSLSITALRTLIGICSGYVLAKVPFRGKGMLWIAYLSALLLPQQIILVPVFHICQILKLNNTIWSLILPLSFSSLGPCLIGYLMKQIPDEICEAARIDGSSTLALLKEIIIPMARPAIILLLLISFAECWNMIEEPLVLITNRRLFPLSLLLSENSENSSATWAGSFVFMIPSFMFFICSLDRKLLEQIVIK